METARISDVTHSLFVRKKVPTSTWPMVPWNGALLTVHSSATQAPRWDWHPRDRIFGSPGHSIESGITQCLGAEISIVAQGSASDPHPLVCAQNPETNQGTREGKAVNTTHLERTNSPRVLFTSVSRTSLAQNQPSISVCQQNSCHRPPYSAPCRTSRRATSATTTSRSPAHS